MMHHWLFSFLVATAAAGTPNAFLNPYLEIQTLLAKDTISGVREAAPKLVSALKKQGLKEASRAAAAIANDSSLSDARIHFQKVSEFLLPWSKKHPLAGVIRAYCPMKKAWWLQAKGPLRNPYYGAEMLECGVEE